MILRTSDVIAIFENASLKKFNSIQEVKDFTKGGPNRLFGMVDMYASTPSKAMAMPKDAPKDKVDAALSVYNDIWDAYLNVAENCTNTDARLWADLARFSTTVSQMAFMKKHGLQMEVTRNGSKQTKSAVIDILGKWKESLKSLDASEQSKQNSAQVCDLLIRDRKSVV